MASLLTLLCVGPLLAPRGAMVQRDVAPAERVQRCRRFEVLAASISAEKQVTPHSIRVALASRDLLRVSVQTFGF